MDSDRSVFNLIKVRCVIDRLIYNYNYPIIDAEMSCSNIGARKKRNIRDHLFVLNSVLHEVSSSEHQIDVQIFDVHKCFDKMWVMKLHMTFMMLACAIISL